MTRITGIAHFALRDGQADRFEELARQCRQVVADLDPGTTRYDVFLSPDRTSAVVIDGVHRLPGPENPSGQYR